MLYQKVFSLIFFVSFAYINAMSHSTTIVPIVAALRTAEDKFLGAGQWNSINENQKKLISEYLSHASDLERFSLEELKNCASCDVKKINEINRFLKENKFDIQLEPMNNPSAFGVASIMNILCNWKKIGKKDRIIFNNVFYPAIRMKNELGNQGYSITKSDVYSQPIIHIETENGDRVSLTKANNPREGFDLLHTIEQIESATKQNITNKYSDVVFPMVDLDHQPDISWLINISKFNKQNQCMYIKQALQQTKFQMDEKGAHAQSAVALGMIRESCDISLVPSLFITEPFYVWITRKGIHMPLFAGYIHSDDWKKPNRD